MTEKLTLRPEVEAFAQEMERVLRRNDDKGGWKECDSFWLLKRLQEELDELKRAVFDMNRRGFELDDFFHPLRDYVDDRIEYHRRKVTDEAADVANIAMMIADVCGGLKR